jgi:hypothetical protein
MIADPEAVVKDAIADHEDLGSDESGVEEVGSWGEGIHFEMAVSIYVSGMQRYVSITIV